MSYIQVSSENHVAVLTIDRAKALNALNSEVLGELDAAIDSMDLGATRCLIITGAGEKSLRGRRRHRRDERPHQGGGRGLRQEGQRCVPQD